MVYGQEGWCSLRVGLACYDAAVLEKLSGLRREVGAATFGCCWFVALIWFFVSTFNPPAPGLMRQKTMRVGSLRESVNQLGFIVGVGGKRRGGEV